MAKNYQKNSGNYKNSGKNLGNAINISGNNNSVVLKQYRRKKETPVSVGANDSYNWALDLAKFFFKLLGKNYIPTFAIVSVLSGIIAVVSIFKPTLFGFAFSEIIAAENSWPTGISLVSLAVSIVFLRLPEKSTCPKCRVPFSMFESDRHFIKEKEIGNDLVRNYKVFEECDNCGFKENYPFVEKDTIN
ncbi:hypothetical protein HYV43_02260 [Candidatus Micrarchaeota archaeon]|nr:hypothetical protein [Candidatus Micrarchaeota archaeon]